MENNESKKDENSCNFYHQLHTENVNFTKNSLVQIALQISCMSEKILTSVVHLNVFRQSYKPAVYTYKYAYETVQHS